MKKLNKYRFTAEILSKGGGAFIKFPYNVETEFGTRGRVKIKALFNGYDYRGSLSPMGMEFHLVIVRKEIREALDKNIGDKIDVIIQEDLDLRIVYVPKDFQAALNKNKLAKGLFEKLAYTHKKEYVNWIEGAKKADTRTRRISKAIEMIALAKKYS